MKKLLCAIALAAFFVGGPRWAFAETTYIGKLVDQTAICVDTNYDLDLNTAQIEKLSFAATYSSATMTATTSPTFTSGRPSTATLTVSDYTALIPRKSTFTVSVQSASSTTLRGTGIIINGDKYYASPGGQWTPVLTATGNATALAAAIDASADWEAVAVSTVVYATATVAGTIQNAWVLTTNSTTSFRLNGGVSAASTPIGGQDRARLIVQGITFDITDSTAVTNSSTTAKNISDTLMANATLAALFTSTWNASGVITSTSATFATNAYTLQVSTPNALRINASATSTTGTFLNGSATTVDPDANTITLANTKLKTGEGVWLSTGGVTPPTGLSQGTTYYIIRVDGNTVKLASSKALASAGTAVDITAQGTAPGTFTLNLIGLTGTPSFKFQVGNDGTNFADYTVNTSSVAISSFTWSAAGTSAWDFGLIDYRYLRLKYTAPTFGGIDITATGNGRK